MKMKVVIQISRRKSLELTEEEARGLHAHLDRLFGGQLPAIQPPPALQPPYIVTSNTKESHVVDDYGTEVK